MTHPQPTEPLYRVVISDEERYSIWPEHKEIPWGWRADQKVGTKQECLDYIKEVWTDMRPLSLRQKMATTEPEPST
jgi:MbtH protein